MVCHVLDSLPPLRHIETMKHISALNAQQHWLICSSKYIFIFPYYFKMNVHFSVTPLYHVK